MGNRINLFVSYENSLGLWHTVPESMTVNSRNNFITAEDFAAWVGEIYLRKGCRRVICTEYKVSGITKTGLKALLAVEADFIDASIRKRLGQRWEFVKNQENQGEKE